jgi:hypothetical protein
MLELRKSSQGALPLKNNVHVFYLADGKVHHWKQPSPTPQVTAVSMLEHLQRWPPLKFEPLYSLLDHQYHYSIILSCRERVRYSVR